MQHNLVQMHLGASQPGRVIGSHVFPSANVQTQTCQVEGGTARIKSRQDRNTLRVIVFHVCDDPGNTKYFSTWLSC